MNCPICPNTSLVMTERQGIEIDYCPTCRGVWLDRGELDKIIERSTVQEPPVPPQHHQSHQSHQPPPRQEYGHYADKDHYKHGQGYGHDHHYKKKKSFFEELFD
jgi:uncharacterized protein